MLYDRDGDHQTPMGGRGPVQPSSSHFQGMQIRKCLHTYTHTKKKKTMLSDIHSVGAHIQVWCRPVVKQ